MFDYDTKEKEHQNTLQSDLYWAGAGALHPHMARKYTYLLQ
jgi:hypothetical protein